MKKILIYLIKLYQKMPLNTHSHCKYVPTCSNYALYVIHEFGAFKGSFLAIKRILRCNPFAKGGLDLPKEKEIL